jgi:hypothetical protein
MLATPDQQISLTDPDARSMATSGRGSGVVGYNVQVDTEYHLIVTLEVTNVGTDRSQLSSVAKEAKATLGAERLDAVADRGYFKGEEILACEEAGITVNRRPTLTPSIALQVFDTMGSFWNRVGSRLDADQSPENSRFHCFSSHLVLNLGWGQSWMPIHKKPCG